VPYKEVHELEALPGPYEILELRPGVTFVLNVERWEQGHMHIRKREDGAEKDIPVLRVYVPKADKITLPAYWDITSKHLQAGLLAYLEAHGPLAHTFRITATGTGPTARPMIEALPLK